MNTAPVMIRMKDETLTQADRLQKSLGAPSRSDVVRRALGLSDLLVRAVRDGGRIYVENHGGKKEILIPGVSNEE